MKSFLKRGLKILMPISFLVVLILFLLNLFYPLPGTDDGAKTLIAAVAPEYSAWIGTIGVEHDLRMEALLLIGQLWAGLLVMIVLIYKYKKHRQLH